MVDQKEVHLLCLVHGMWGNPKHLGEAARIMSEKAATRNLEEGGPAFELLVAKTNSDTGTYDGIDWGGERIADEILQEIDQLEKQDGKKVVKISFLGYSLGGLLARYVIGIFQSKAIFDRIQAVNFTTIATPHIGLLRYSGLWSSLTSRLGPRLLSRTGEQFYVADTWGSTGRSLLEVMADPTGIFVAGLRRFKNRSVYANAVHDLTVPYATAAIESKDPFFDHKTSGIELTFNEEYRPVLVSFNKPDTPPPPLPGPHLFSKAWWKAHEPLPILQFKFPAVLILYILSPILLPTFLTIAVVRLTIESRASRSRIRLIETGPSVTSNETETRLINVFRHLEKKMDDTVADIMDHQSDNSAPSNKKHPILKPSQYRMVKNLNASLPDLQKYMVFIHPTINSHAIIVAREVERFEIHKLGYGVLRHWADGFEF